MMRRFTVIFLLLAMLTALVSCGGGAGTPVITTTADPASGNVTTVAPEMSEVSEVSDTSAPLSDELSISGAELVIVRPSDCGKAVISAAQRVHKYLCEALGEKLRLKDDWVKPGEDPDAVSQHEVLVGETNRSAGAGVECESGWYVGVRGNKVIIIASREKYYDAAVEYFISQCRQGEDGALKIMRSTDHYEHVDDVYAGVELTLRVGSYNIHHGSDVGLDMTIIARDITELELDVVGFQEIDFKTTRTGGIDTMKELSEASGYEYYSFARAIDYKGGQYGTGILSRYPIESFEVISLAGLGGEDRSVGHAVLNINGVKLDFFNTHLDYELLSRRSTQIERIAPYLAECEAYIVTGDFNTADIGEFAVWDGAGFVNNNTYATFPKSGKAIDNIIFSPDWSVVKSGMGPQGHSDHRLLWAELSFKRS